MFCFENGKHNALTAFHVGCVTDKQRFDNAFDRQEHLEALNPEAVRWRKEYAKNQMKYYVTKEIPSKDKNENSCTGSVSRIDLGKFVKGSFDEESDIMSIEVNEEVDCKVENVNLPNWSTIWGELHKRVVRKRGIDVLWKYRKLVRHLR